MITNAKSCENPITIHNKENIKNITLLGTFLLNLENISFNKPVLINVPTPSKPKIIVPNGIYFNKLLTASPNKNLKPSVPIKDFTVNIFVVTLPD